MLLEVCWRMRGRSDYVFRCGIYRTMPNLVEVAVIRGDGRDVSIVFSHDGAGHRGRAQAR